MALELMFKTVLHQNSLPYFANLTFNKKEKKKNEANWSWKIDEECGGCELYRLLPTHVSLD